MKSEIPQALPGFWKCQGTGKFCQQPELFMVGSPAECFWRGPLRWPLASEQDFPSPRACRPLSGAGLPGKEFAALITSSSSNVSAGVGTQLFLLCMSTSRPGLSQAFSGQLLGAERAGSRGSRGGMWSQQRGRGRGRGQGTSCCATLWGL